MNRKEILNNINELFEIQENEERLWKQQVEYLREIERLHSIIKEVREILLNYGETFDLKVHQEMQKKLLEILDKVGDIK